MAKVDNGRRMRVEYIANGFKSFLGEKAAKILEERKVVKILGPAEDAPKAKKVTVK